MMYYRISKNEKNLFFGKKIAQVWAVTLSDFEHCIFIAENLAKGENLAGNLVSGLSLSALRLILGSVKTS